MSLTEANNWLMDNIVVFLVAIILLGIGLFFSTAGNSKKRKLGYASLAIGGFSIAWVLIAIFYIISAGSTLVIGNWAIYGREPETFLQWALVWGAAILFSIYAILFVFGAFDEGGFTEHKQKKRHKRKK